MSIPAEPTVPPTLPPVPTCRMCEYDHAPGSPQCPLQRIGTTVAGKYRMDRLLGCGGMGAVYEAENVTLGKRVAVKMLHARLAARADVVARFRREARAIANLHHHGFPQVYSLDATETGELLIEMELLRGTPVDKLIAELPIERARTILMSALDALAVAHEAGLVHRDLKPENLFWCDDHTKLLDFGIARADDDQHLTRTGEVFGTISYASPEQLQNANKADARSDVYSMGATAFELLTGRTAAGTGGMTEILTRILADQIEHHPRTLRPGVPAELDAWVARALEAEPAKRFATARDMLEALRGQPETPPAAVPATLPAAVPATPAATSPATPAPTVPPPPAATSRRGLLLAGAAVAVAGVIVVVVMSRSSPAAHEAPAVVRDAAVALAAPIVPAAPVAPIDAAPVPQGPLLTVDLTVWKGNVALAPKATLHTGERIAFQVATSAPAYVYLVQRTNADLDVLFPSAVIPTTNPIPKAVPVRIPKAGGFTLVDDGVYGPVVVNVIASATPLPDLDGALVSMASQQGKVRETTIRTAQAQVPELLPSGGGVPRGRLELLDDTERHTVSVRFSQRPGDALVVASFEFEQVK